MKMQHEIIDKLITHYKYREDYTKKNGKDPEYEYENGCIRSLLWVLEKDEE